MLTIIGIKLYYGSAGEYDCLMDPLGLFISPKNIPWNNISAMEFTFDGVIPIPLSTSDFTLTDTATNPLGGVVSNVTVNGSNVHVSFSPQLYRGIYELSSNYDGNILEPINLPFRVLTGDINNSNTIDTYDLYLIRSQFTNPPTVPYSQLHDINGDGVVDLQDYAVTSQRRLNRLP
jgi:hypothetical protein